MNFSDKKIVFLGDSITHGDCIENRDNSYVNTVIREMGFKKAFNHSVPGSRIAEYIGEDPKKIGPSFVKRFSGMEDDADIVVVFGGTNDFGIGNEPVGAEDDETDSTLCGGLNILMKGLCEKYPLAKIIVITPLHRKNENEPNKFSGEPFISYISAIRAAAKKYNAKLLDLYGDKDLQPSDEYYDALIINDGLHPNMEGHRVIADKLIEFIKKLY